MEGSAASGVIHRVVDIPSSVELIVLSFDEEELVPEMDEEYQEFVD